MYRSEMHPGPNRSMNLLMTSAGRRNQLMQCFREGASRLGLDLRVLATDLHPEWSSACQQADAAIKVPRCNAPDYIPTLLQLCRDEKISVLVPTIDPELEALSRHRDEFAAIGTRVVVSGVPVVRLAGDKFATAETLAAAGIPTPKTVRLTDYLRDPAQLRFPVIAKPNAGSASVGIIRPKAPADLAGIPPENYIVQELWLGREYTINVFFDDAGQLRCAVPHERIEVRAGEVSKGITRRMPELEAAALKLANALPDARGPLCFQALVAESGDFAVFEINARFGGGYPLAHRSGARFSQWILEETAGLSVSAHNNWNENVVMLRHDTAVFIDG